jgi:hypothetical protein
MKSNGRWRWVTEGFVIVASILLAFWIDAWWDGVQGGRQEAALVEAVREELENNRESLRFFLAIGAAHLDRVDRFLRTTPEQLRAMPTDSVHPMVEAMWLPPTFDAQISATTMFLDSPPRSTSESLVSRQLVGGWSRQLADAQEEGMDLRAHASEVVDMLAAVSVTLPPPPPDPILDWSLADLSLQNRTFVSTAIEQGGGETLARLRADDAFVIALARKMHDQRRYNFELAQASERLELVLAALASASAR